LRAIRVDSGFSVDDGLRGQIELDPQMQSVVRALWNPAEAPREVLLAAATHGGEAILEAVERLRGAQIVFDDRASCDAFVDSMLSAAANEIPFVDPVELTNICPFKCQFCPRGVEGKMKRATGRMSFELFRLLSQLHPDQGRFRPFELHHLGESLIHPELDRFIRAASDRGLPTEMSCNPSVLNLCSYPWRSVVVLWDGRVVPCCLDSDAALVLGDLNHQSLAEIWASEPVRALRQGLEANIPRGHLCDGCGWCREKYASEMDLRHPDKAKSEPLFW